MTELRTTCEFSRLDEERGYYHCNRLSDTTVYRKDSEKRVCEQHAKELVGGEHVLKWRMEENE